jgi:hypothetical protein
MIVFLAQLLLWRWLLRWAARLTRWAIGAVVMLAAAPVTIVTVTAVTMAWLRGWPPAGLRRAAAWSAPMTGVYLTVQAVTDRSWQAALAAPYLDWQAGWHATGLGNAATAFVLCVPVAVPAGLLIASWEWAARIYRIETGLAGKTATAPVVFDHRQWRRQARAARNRNAAPGNVPLTDTRGRIVIGATIRSIGHRWQPALAVPYQAMGRHQVIIGSSGSGKTNLMIRTWAGWYTAARHATQLHGAARPLLVVLDCKGGPDARAKAARTRALLHAAGAATVAIWPDNASVSLWTLPPRDLAVTLFQLLDTTDTGPAAYYADITHAALMLAVTAPPGPPACGAEFLDRLGASWLEAAYAGDWPRLSAVRAVARHLPDVALRYRTLLDRLGPGFDGTATLSDADAWYLILEGTSQQSVAQAQALAITELLACAATSLHTEPRTILLACDDYSAVSGKVPLWQLYERGRSLGIGVQVSAQSWHGLGATDDDRYRIAATADGGIWMLRTPHPEPISQLAGTRQVIETATKVIGRMWGDEGSSRVQHAWTADPGIARRLDAGQAAWISGGACTWVQIARTRPSPLRRPAVPVPAVPVIVPPVPASQGDGRGRATGDGDRPSRPSCDRARAHAVLIARTVPAVLLAAGRRHAARAGSGVRGLSSRIRDGRPVVLALRFLAGAALATITLHAGAGPAPDAGVLAGIIIWLALTADADLAPPPARNRPPRPGARRHRPAARPSARPPVPAREWTPIHNLGVSLTRPASGVYPGVSGSRISHLPPLAARPPARRFRTAATRPPGSNATHTPHHHSTTSTTPDNRIADHQRPGA